MFTAREINAAIDSGKTVTARHSDLRRTGQPAPGAIVTVTRAFDGNSGIRVTARGFKGRFGVEDVNVQGGIGYDTEIEL